MAAVIRSHVCRFFGIVERTMIYKITLALLLAIPATAKIRGRRLEDDCDLLRNQIPCTSTGTGPFECTVKKVNGEITYLELDYIGDLKGKKFEEICGVLSDKVECSYLDGLFTDCDDARDECEFGGTFWVACEAPGA